MVLIYTCTGEVQRGQRTNFCRRCASSNVHGGASLLAVMLCHVHHLLQASPGYRSHLLLCASLLMQCTRCKMPKAC